MKILINRISLVVRLSITASALLFSQQVFAAGTDAGVTVNNTATVTWSVGGNEQTPFDAPAPPFVVDRRVDFTVGSDGATADVNPGDTGIEFRFPFASTGNSELDFLVEVFNLPLGTPTIDGRDDTGHDVSTLAFTAWYDNVDPNAAGFDIIVTGEAALTLVNDNVANLRVTVTAFHPDGTEVARQALVNTDAIDDDPDAIDNVFANSQGLGIEVVYDGMHVVSAALLITKDNATFWDPINLLVSPKAIPGSVVEYIVAAANTGPLLATGVFVSDVIELPTVLIDASNNPVPPLLTQPYSGGNVQFFDGTNTHTCIAEVGGGDGNGDGCYLTGTTLTIRPVAPAFPLDVAALTGILEIRFQVLVP
jgi:uncharacterized repeat protein (TIGR01451 family)